MNWTLWDKDKNPTAVGLQAPEQNITIKLVLLKLLTCGNAFMPISKNNIQIPLVAEDFSRLFWDHITSNWPQM